MRNVTAACVLLAAGVAAGAVPTHSVESFNGLKSRWQNFAETGITLKVEGRRGFFARTLLRFRNCELSFRPKSGTEFPKLSGTGRNIEVLGRLEKRNGELEFVVEQLTERPSDLETFQIKQGDIRSDEPDEWYSLGDWAARRAAFYKDEALKQKAEEAYRKGIAGERRQLAEGDVDGLMRLAAKAARLNLPDSLRLEFLHEAYQLRWEALQKAPPDSPGRSAGTGNAPTTGKTQTAAQELARQLADDLPGCRQPLESPLSELRKKYWDNPLTVYRTANDETRRQLHRMFYCEIVLKEILKQAKADGSNGFDIAQAIDRQVPERHALAETYRKRELDFKLARVETDSRQQVLQLAEQFRRRHEPQKARQAVKQWLDAKAKRVREEGPAGLVKIADEYEELLDDQETAAKLLMEASRQIPNSEEIAAKLNRLGYRRADGQWISDEALEKRPPDPVQRAVREGRVVAGMTPEQVRKALGAPTSTTRIATAGRISEVWSYGERGTSRLAIHFLRRSAETTQDAQVVGISQIKP